MEHPSPYQIAKRLACFFTLVIPLDGGHNFFKPCNTNYNIFLLFITEKRTIIVGVIENEGFIFRKLCEIVLHGLFPFFRIIPPVFLYIFLVHFFITPCASGSRWQFPPLDLSIVPKKLWRFCIAPNTFFAEGIDTITARRNELQVVAVFSLVFFLPIRILSLCNHIPLVGVPS